MDRSTITRAVGEIRPLLAARGFAVPGKPGLRLRTLADVFAYATAEGVELRIDGTEVQVRRPKANRPGRRAFVSGKRKQNTIKPTVISDKRGRLLWCGAVRPGRMHDVTKDADDTQHAEYDKARHAQSSQRIWVEHAIAEPKQWRPLQRYIGHREHFEDTMLAIAGLVSDRAAER